MSLLWTWGVMTNSFITSFIFHWLGSLEFSLHSTRLNSVYFRSDCLRLLNDCVDWGRSPPEQSPESICRMLSAQEDPPSCVSLSMYSSKCDFHNSLINIGWRISWIFYRVFPLLNFFSTTGTYQKNTSLFKVVLS